MTGILRIILIFLLLYFVVKIVRLVIRYLNLPQNKINNIKENQSVRSNSFDRKKYNDIQDAEFKEIKSDDNSKNDQK